MSDHKEEPPKTQKLKETVRETDLDWVLQSHKKLMYTVDKIGTVIEEIRVFSKRQPDAKVVAGEAMHFVYINQKLARQKNMATGKVIQSDPKYEPYDFLRGIILEPSASVDSGGYVSINQLLEEIQKNKPKTK